MATDKLWQTVGEHDDNKKGPIEDGIWNNWVQSAKMSLLSHKLGLLVASLGIGFGLPMSALEAQGIKTINNSQLNEKLNQAGEKAGIKDVLDANVASANRAHEKATTDQWTQITVIGKSNPTSANDDLNKEKMARRNKIWEDIKNCKSLKEIQEYTTANSITKDDPDSDMIRARLAEIQTSNVTVVTPNKAIELTNEQRDFLSKQNALKEALKSIDSARLSIAATLEKTFNENKGKMIWKEVEKTTTYLKSISTGGIQQTPKAENTSSPIVNVATNKAWREEKLMLEKNASKITNLVTFLGTSMKKWGKLSEQAIKDLDKGNIKGILFGEVLGFNVNPPLVAKVETPIASAKVTSPSRTAESSQASLTWAPSYTAPKAVANPEIEKSANWAFNVESILVKYPGYHLVPMGTGTPRGITPDGVSWNLKPSGVIDITIAESFQWTEKPASVAFPLPTEGWKYIVVPVTQGVSINVNKKIADLHPNWSYKRYVAAAKKNNTTISVGGSWNHDHFETWDEAYSVTVYFDWRDFKLETNESGHIYLCVLEKDKTNAAN